MLSGVVEAPFGVDGRPGEWCTRFPTLRGENRDPAEVAAAKTGLASRSRPACPEDSKRRRGRSGTSVSAIGSDGLDELDGDATEPSRTSRWFCSTACLCGETESEPLRLRDRDGERDREREGVLRSFSELDVGEAARDCDTNLWSGSSANGALAVFVCGTGEAMVVVDVRWTIVRRDRERRGGSGRYQEAREQQDVWLEDAERRVATRTIRCCCAASVGAWDWCGCDAAEDELSEGGEKVAWER